MSDNRNIFKYENAALLLIDYQKEMFDTVRSESSAELIEFNVLLLIRAAKAFAMPIILSTVGVDMGVNSPTRPSLVAELPGIDIIDRSSMNAWEDPSFHAAVVATGRRQLIVCALYTEICLTYPVLEALGAGYDVTFPVDAVGGLSQLAHRSAVDRLAHAGAAPNTALALVTELFRDWKSPVADKARGIIKPYLAGLPSLATGYAPAAARDE